MYTIFDSACMPPIFIAARGGSSCLPVGYKIQLNALYGYRGEVITRIESECRQLNCQVSKYVNRPDITQRPFESMFSFESELKDIINDETCFVDECYQMRKRTYELDYAQQSIGRFASGTSSAHNGYQSLDGCSTALMKYDFITGKTCQ